MLIAANDIYSVSEFTRKTPEHLARLKETRKPQILTHNGRAALVIQDAQAYEEMVEKLETLQRIARAARAFDRGEGIPVEQAFEQLNQRIAEKYPNEEI